MKIINHIFIIVIKFYKLILSPFFGANCRYQPTCSSYCIGVMEKHNTIYALCLCVKRILSCNPFGGEGHDPIP